MNADYDALILLVVAFVAGFLLALVILKELFR